MKDYYYIFDADPEYFLRTIFKLIEFAVFIFPVNGRQYKSLKQYLGNVCSDFSLCIDVCYLSPAES